MKNLDRRSDAQLEWVELPRRSQPAHAHFVGAAASEMGFALVEKALPDESLRQQEFHIFVRPFSSGQGLQEHQNLLKVHGQKLV